MTLFEQLKQCKPDLEYIMYDGENVELKLAGEYGHYAKDDFSKSNDPEPYRLIEQLEDFLNSEDYEGQPKFGGVRFGTTNE